MHAHAPVPAVGRETLVKIIERWAIKGSEDVVLVFDGPVPRGGLAQQMSSRRIQVRFSEKQSADDVIVELIHAAKEAGHVRVVSSDRAIQTEAGYRRCAWNDSRTFVSELFDEDRDEPTPPPAPAEKPDADDPAQTHDWLREFGFDGDDDEPFDGHSGIAP